MSKMETAIYYVIGSIAIHLALAVLRYIISFLLRYWILLIVLATAIYIAFRHLKYGGKPWWLAKIKDLLPRMKRKGGNT